MVTELWIHPAAETLEFLDLPQKPPTSLVPHSGASVLRGTFLTQAYELSIIPPGAIPALRVKVA